ncbi:MAG TPA: ANTAR domain-containing protein [Jatrophihabitantaceae bacterium]
MTSASFVSSDALAQELSSLHLPVDSASLAPICARLLASLRAAEARLERMRLNWTTNRRVGIAQGIVMVTHRGTDAEAFQILQRMSRRRGIDMRTLADEVIASALDGDAA